MELRLAQPADVREIAQLARREVERGLDWTWDDARVASELQDPDSLCVVAPTFSDANEEDGIAGFCITAFGDDDAHILLIAVARDAQRRGIGTQLLQWQLTCARTAGVARVCLELRAGNARAKKFYETHGFHVVRRVRHYYQGREDALRMVLTLR